MEYLYKFYSDRLYRGMAVDRGCGELYLAIATPLQKGSLSEYISIEEAVRNQSGHNGILLFSARPVLIESEEEAGLFLEAISQFLKNEKRTDRAVIWMDGTEPCICFNGFFLGVNMEASQVTASLSVPLARELNFVVPNGTRLSFDGACMSLERPGGACVFFEGSNVPAGYAVQSATLSFSGKKMGAFQFDAHFKKNSFISSLNPGFTISYPVRQEQATILRSFRFPMWMVDDALSGNAAEYLSFHVCLDPTDRYNHTHDVSDFPEETSPYATRSTYFDFQPGFGKQEPILSFFRTIYGNPIYLLPVTGEGQGGCQNGRLVFCAGPEAGSLLCPEGDFLLSNPKGCDNSLLCGVEGLESIRFCQGDALRFLSGKPAFVPVFPLPQASTVGEPINFDEMLLDDTYTTSWAAFTMAEEPFYLTQPRGMCYYASSQETDSLLFPKDILRPMDRSIFFPMVPFAGVETDLEAAEEIERQIISRERLRLLGNSLPMADRHADGLQRIATPAGFLADVDTDGRFARIYLANNAAADKHYRLYFEAPSPSLVQAFQSNPLFLVINNTNYLNHAAFCQAFVEQPGFHDAINIGDWIFSLQPGLGNAYNDYKTIMIIKGCQGKLYDPVSGGLAANPLVWTNWKEFASPAMEGMTNPDQITNLSTWLVSYCSQASRGDGAYFSAFNRIVGDENWQGILFLHVPLRQENLPESMSGVLCGLPEGVELCAHHIGIHMTQLTQKDGILQQDGNSSLFGLVYYEDPGFAGTGQLISPLHGDYGFLLLSLKALFENSALNKFENYAQLTIGTWFGLKPDHMTGGDYNSILLCGGYQNQNGCISYALRSTADSLYYFKTSYLNKIEINLVQMSIMDAKTQSYVFRLSGFLDFKDLDGFDLFSYGNNSGMDRPKQGLAFSNISLLLVMKETGQEFTFDCTGFTADLRNSVPRPQSLAGCLLLKPEGMLCADGGKMPGDYGYLPVSMEKKCGGAGEAWYGLVLSLPMGSLGELAEKVNLSARLLLAFGPEEALEERRISVWIHLPGSGGKSDFLSLQNLLKLSIDQIFLTQKDGAFQLLLTDIALKIFGIVTIPPSGTTSFTLFGSGRDGGEPGWFAAYLKNEKNGGEDFTYE